MTALPSKQNGKIMTGIADLRESVARALMDVRAQMPGGGLDGPELPVLDMDIARRRVHGDAPLFAETAA